jgi:hypothetical protein
MRKGVDTHDIYNFKKRALPYGRDKNDFDTEYTNGGGGGGGDDEDSIDALINDIPSSSASSGSQSSCNDHYDALERESEDEKRNQRKRQVQIGSVNATISPAIAGKQQVLLSSLTGTRSIMSNGGGGVDRSNIISIPIVTTQCPPKCVSLKDAYEKERHVYSARLDRKVTRPPPFFPVSLGDKEDDNVRGADDCQIVDERCVNKNKRKRGAQKSCLKEEEEEEEGNGEDNNSNRKKKSRTGDEDEESNALLVQPRSFTNEINLYNVEDEDDEDNEEEEQQHRTVNGKKECFLCAWGDRFHDGIKAPHIQKLETIIDDCYGYYSNEDLAQQVHLYYKEVVYDPTRGMAMLTAVDVLRHIEELHSLNAKIYIGENIRDWRRIEAISRNKICREDGTIDAKAVIAAERATKMTLSLYKCKIQNLLFNKGVSTEDVNRLGAYHNIMPMYSQQQERSQIQERRRLNVTSSFNTFH